jgi:hypothetical protein
MLQIPGMGDEDREEESEEADAEADLVASP